MRLFKRFMISGSWKLGWGLGRSLSDTNNELPSLVCFSSDTDDGLSAVDITFPRIKRLEKRVGGMAASPLLKVEVLPKKRGFKWNPTPLPQLIPWLPLHLVIVVCFPFMAWLAKRFPGRVPCILKKLLNNSGTPLLSMWGSLRAKVAKWCGLWFYVLE